MCTRDGQSEKRKGGRRKGERDDDDNEKQNDCLSSINKGLADQTWPDDDRLFRANPHSAIQRVSTTALYTTAVQFASAAFPCVTLCFITLCYVTLGYVTLSYVTSCYVAISYVALGYGTEGGGPISIPADAQRAQLIRSRTLRRKSSGPYPKFPKNNTIIDTIISLPFNKVQYLTLVN